MKKADRSFGCLVRPETEKGAKRRTVMFDQLTSSYLLLHELQLHLKSGRVLDAVLRREVGNVSLHQRSRIKTRMRKPSFNGKC